MEADFAGEYTSRQALQTQSVSKKFKVKSNLFFQNAIGREKDTYIIHVIVAYGFKKIDENKPPVHYRVDSRMIMTQKKASKEEKGKNADKGPGLVKEHCRSLIEKIRERNLLDGFTRALIVSDNAASVCYLSQLNLYFLRNTNAGAL